MFLILKILKAKALLALLTIYNILPEMLNWYRASALPLTALAYLHLRLKEKPL